MKWATRIFFPACLLLAAIGTSAIAVPADTTPSPVAVPSTASADASPAATTPPRYVSHWDFVDDDSLPIELRHTAAIVDLGGAYVTFNATVDGKSGTFLLDTGAAGVILSQRFVAGLDLPQVGTTSFSGIAGNRIAARAVLVKDLGVGKSVLHDVVVVVSANENADLGRHLDGTIGYELFAKAIVDVDLAAQTMRVYDPARFEPTVTKKSFIFDVDLTRRVPQTTGTVGNGIIIHPIFDTGNSLLLSLSDSLRNGNRLVGTHATTLSFRGVDGQTANIDCAHVGHVSFGPINYEATIACFYPPKVFAPDGGLVGFDFLQHFNWTIDYPDKKFVLTPNGL